MRCGTCKYFNIVNREHSLSTKWGECHYSKPDSRTNHGAWPAIEEDKWCGEWSTWTSLPLIELLEKSKNNT